MTPSELEAFLQGCFFGGALMGLLIALLMAVPWESFKNDIEPEDWRK